MEWHWRGDYWKRTDMEDRYGAARLDALLDWEPVGILQVKG